MGKENGNKWNLTFLSFRLIKYFIKRYLCCFFSLNLSYIENDEKCCRFYTVEGHSKDIWRINQNLMVHLIKLKQTLQFYLKFSKFCLKTPRFFSEICFHMVGKKFIHKMSESFHLKTGENFCFIAVKCCWIHSVM